MLKKEVRILGLSATAVMENRTVVIGVVFRGNLWLDGMVATLLDLKKQDHISIVSRLIMRSKQYSQLRAVVLSREHLFPSEKMRIADLACCIKLPVIRIIWKTLGSTTRSRGRANANRCNLVVNGKHVSALAAGLSCQEAQRMFNVACANNRKIPEAARVADLIAKQVPTRVLAQISQSQDFKQDASESHKSTNSRGILRDFVSSFIS